MNEAANSSFITAVIIIAASSVAATAILYWIGKNFTSSSHSLKNLIESVDDNVNTTMKMLQRSIEDINVISKEIGGKMERLDAIVDNVEKISEDVRASTDIVNRTVVPTLGNLHSVSAGIRKAVETWNDFDGGTPGRTGAADQD